MAMTYSPISSPPPPSFKATEHGTIVYSLWEGNERGMTFYPIYLFIDYLFFARGISRKREKLKVSENL